MVGVPGKSQGCTTCRRRKVRCDQQKPLCQRCSAFGRQCEGYERYSVFINRGQEGLKKRERLEEAKAPKYVPEAGFQDASMAITPFSTQANEMQLISSFWETYAADSPRCTKPTEPAWLYQSIGSSAPPPTLKKALLSLAYIRLGRLSDDQAMIVRGQQMYGRTLRLMQKALSDDQLAYSDEILAAAQCMVLYESFESTSGNMAAWQNHNMGIARIIELRGIYRHRTVISRSVLETVRYNVMIVSLLRRQASFLGEPEWLTEPWAGTSKDYDQRLFDHGFMLAKLMQESEALQQHSAQQQMLEILRQIRDGYLGLFILNEELLAKRDKDQSPPEDPLEADSADEAPFATTIVNLIALDLTFSIFATALMQKYNKQFLTNNQELFDQLYQYTDPKRRREMAQQLLHHLSSTFQTRAKHMRPRVIFPLNVLRWELRNSPEDNARVRAMFDAIASKHHFRIADGVRNAGRSTLPPIVTESAGPG